MAGKASDSSLTGKVSDPSLAEEVSGPSLAEEVSGPDLEVSELDARLSDSDDLFAAEFSGFEEEI